MIIMTKHDKLWQNIEYYDSDKRWQYDKLWQAMTKKWDMTIITDDKLHVVWQKMTSVVQTWKASFDRKWVTPLG